MGMSLAELRGRLEKQDQPNDAKLVAEERLTVVALTTTTHASAHVAIAILPGAFDTDAPGTVSWHWDAGGILAVCSFGSGHCAAAHTAPATHVDRKAASRAAQRAGGRIAVEELRHRQGTIGAGVLLAARAALRVRAGVVRDVTALVSTFMTDVVGPVAGGITVVLLARLDCGVCHGQRRGGTDNCK